jgi:hypothetical protein
MVSGLTDPGQQIDNDPSKLRACGTPSLSLSLRVTHKPLP